MNFYRPQRSCGKVMFSEARVKNSVHSGGVGVYTSMHFGRHPPAQCMLGYTRPGQTPHGQTSPWQTPPWADTPSLGRDPLADTSPGQTPRPLPPSSHCSGRYASYWNASLYFTITALSLVVLPTQYADCHSILDHILD